MKSRKSKLSKILDKTYEEIQTEIPSSPEDKDDNEGIKLFTKSKTIFKFKVKETEPAPQPMTRPDLLAHRRIKPDENHFQSVVGVVYARIYAIYAPEPNIGPKCV